MPKHIVKSHGAEEHYESRKVYASAFRAARNAHLSEDEAEAIGSKVALAIDSWIETRDEVGTDQIFKKITEELEKHNPDAAFLYKTHRDVN